MPRLRIDIEGLDRARRQSLIDGGRDAAPLFRRIGDRAPAAGA